jgi:hypothetical protein
MKWMSVAVALALLGCSSTPQSNHVGGDLTVGTAHCSKFSWGTSQMAECLDRAAESQAATMSAPQADGKG